MELDPPSDGEVLVEMVSCGLCHSEDHMATGDLPAPIPVVGGHEGAGIVREVGPGVRDLQVGDHVVSLFIPAGGRCRWCVAGMQQLCDSGAMVMHTGGQMDGTFRMHLGDINIGAGGLLGCFSEWQVFDERSLVTIPKQMPLGVAGLIGCAVPTGWGSAVHGGEVRPGDVVVVMGCGGIGMNAVQGVRHAGATHVIAVDPVAFKRDMAPTFGATESFASLADADGLIRSLTNGQGADVVIVTVGVHEGEHVARSPRQYMTMLADLYLDGHLKLDELVTTHYRLDQINEGFADMHAGTNIRGVIDL